MRFIEVSDLAAYLHRTLDSGDALANFACDVATEVTREYIDQNVEAGSNTVKLDGDGCSDALFIPQFPVTSIGTIATGVAKEITAATRVLAVATFTVESHGYEVDDLVYINGV